MTLFFRFFRLPLLVLTLSAALPAQPERQAENWHFGFGQSVTFTAAGPVADPPTSVAAFEGVVSLSDANGQLLFYSNGGGRPPDPMLPADAQPLPGTIWNRAHGVLYDLGGTQGGGISARQSCLAFPDPSGTPDRYYLFTVDENEFATREQLDVDPLGRGLSYFVIDMALNDGLGGVVEGLADQRVYVPAYEALDATPMTDGAGYWVLTHSGEADNPRFAVVGVTAAGVGRPREVPTGRVAGRLKFSPDGRHFINDGRLFSFDPATGTVAADPVELPLISSQAVTFTPDSRYFFTLQTDPDLGDLIVRYETATLDVLPVAPVSRPGDEINLLFGNFQLGPNGYVYFAEQAIGPGRNEYGLSEIRCPSSSQPTVNRFLLPLQPSGNFSSQTLPAFVDAIFRNLTSADTTLLDTLAVASCRPVGQPVPLTARETGLSYRWDTGEEDRTIAVTDLSPGRTYCVTVTDECGVIIDCQQPRYRADGLSLELLRTEEPDCEAPAFVYRLNATEAFDALNVLLLDAGLGQIQAAFTVVDTNVFRVPALAGAEGFVLQLGVVLPGCSDPLGVTTATPAYEPAPDFAPFVVDPVGEEAPCAGLPFTVEIGNRGGGAIATVLFPDATEGNPGTITVSAPGPFPLRVVDNCGDTVTVVYDLPIREFCDCEAAIPQLITPNGDGNNDVFRLFSTLNCPVLDYNLIVYNRWGQPVFRSTDPNQAWDGSSGGSPQNTDVYLYRMTYRFPDEELRRAEGQFSLIR